MKVKVIKLANPTQAWVCSKCGNRRGSIVKPPSFGCSVAANKQHSWRKA